MRKTIWAALAAAGFVAAGSGVAWATGLTSFGFVGGDGTIAACVQTSNGDVRFVDPSSPSKDLSSCRAGETQVMLNQGTSQGPANVTVDCPGQSIQQALDDNAAASSVQITVNGTCVESVQIQRDDVQIDAGSPGAGIQSPSAGQSVVTVTNAQNVVLGGLTLSGGSIGLDVWQGAAVRAENVTISGTGPGVNAHGSGSVLLDQPKIEGAGQNGATAFAGGTIEIHGGTISGSAITGICGCGGAVWVMNTVVDGSGFQGIASNGGGNVAADGVTVENTNGQGVSAFNGGSIQVDSGSVVEGSTREGVVAQGGGSVNLQGVDVESNGGDGVLGYGGGHVTIQGGSGTVIESNARNGVHLTGGSTAALQGAIVIRNNANDGVSLDDTSVALVNQDNQITGNGGWGIFCEGTPAVAQISGQLPSPDLNGGGQDNCPHS